MKQRSNIIFKTYKNGTAYPVIDTTKDIYFFPMVVSSGHTGVDDKLTFNSVNKRYIYTGRKSVIIKPLGWETDVTLHHVENDGTISEIPASEITKDNLEGKELVGKRNITQGIFFVGKIVSAPTFTQNYRTSKLGFVEKKIDSRIEAVFKEDENDRLNIIWDFEHNIIKKNFANLMFMCPELNENNILDIETITVYVNESGKYVYHSIVFVSLNEKLEEAGRMLGQSILFSHPGSSFFLPYVVGSKAERVVNKILSDGSFSQTKITVPKHACGYYNKEWLINGDLIGFGELDNTLLENKKTELNAEDTTDERKTELTTEIATMISDAETKALEKINEIELVGTPDRRSAGWKIVPGIDTMQLALNGMSGIMGIEVYGRKKLDDPLYISADIKKLMFSSLSEPTPDPLSLTYQYESSHEIIPNAYFMLNNYAADLLQELGVEYDPRMDRKNMGSIMVNNKSSLDYSKLNYVNDFANVVLQKRVTFVNGKTRTSVSPLFENKEIYASKKERNIGENQTETIYDVGDVAENSGKNNDLTLDYLSICNYLNFISIINSDLMFLSPNVVQITNWKSFWGDIIQQGSTLVGALIGFGVGTAISKKSKGGKFFATAGAWIGSQLGNVVRKIYDYAANANEEMFIKRKMYNSNRRSFPFLISSDALAMIHSNLSVANQLLHGIPMVLFSTSDNPITSVMDSSQFNDIYKLKLTDKFKTEPLNLSELTEQEKVDKLNETHDTKELLNGKFKIGAKLLALPQSEDDPYEFEIDWIVIKMLGKRQIRLTFYDNEDEIVGFFHLQNSALFGGNIREITTNIILNTRNDNYSSVDAYLDTLINLQPLDLTPIEAVSATANAAALKELYGFIDNDVLIFEEKIKEEEKKHFKVNFNVIKNEIFAYAIEKNVPDNAIDYWNGQKTILLNKIDTLEEHYSFIIFENFKRYIELYYNSSTLLEMKRKEITSTVILHASLKEQLFEKINSFQENNNIIAKERAEAAGEVDKAAKIKAYNDFASQIIATNTEGDLTILSNTIDGDTVLDDSDKTRLKEIIADKISDIQQAYVSSLVSTLNYQLQDFINKYESSENIQSFNTDGYIRSILQLDVDENYNSFSADKLETLKLVATDIDADFLSGDKTTVNIDNAITTLSSFQANNILSLKTQTLFDSHVDVTLEPYDADTNPTGLKLDEIPTDHQKQFLSQVFNIPEETWSSFNDLYDNNNIFINKTPFTLYKYFSFEKVEKYLSNTDIATIYDTLKDYVAPDKRHSTTIDFRGEYNGKDGDTRLQNFIDDTPQFNWEVTTDTSTNVGFNTPRAYISAMFMSTDQFWITIHNYNYNKGHIISTVGDDPQTFTLEQIKDIISPSLFDLYNTNRTKFFTIVNEINGNITNLTLQKGDPLNTALKEKLLHHRTELLKTITTLRFPNKSSSSDPNIETTPSKILHVGSSGTFTVPYLNSNYDRTPGDTFDYTTSYYDALNNASDFHRLSNNWSGGSGSNVYYHTGYYIYWSNILKKRWEIKLPYSSTIQPEWKTLSFELRYDFEWTYTVDTLIFFTVGINSLASYFTDPYPETLRINVTIDLQTLNDGESKSFWISNVELNSDGAYQWKNYKTVYQENDTFGQDIYFVLTKSSTGLSMSFSKWSLLYWLGKRRSDITSSILPNEISINNIKLKV